MEVLARLAHQEKAFHGRHMIEMRAKLCQPTTNWFSFAQAREHFIAYAQNLPEDHWLCTMKSFFLLIFYSNKYD